MKQLVPLAIILLPILAPAQTTYLGLYLRGNKIGYASYESSSTMLAGLAVNRSDSKTIINAGLLGTAMSMTLTSKSWTTKDGEPIQMSFDTLSQGRESKLEAHFHAQTVEMDLVNGGVRSHRSLDLPLGGKVVDDPISLVLSRGMRPGTSRIIFVLDPSTASFMKNIVQYVGPTKVIIENKPVPARLVKITDSTSVTDVFINKKGDVLRVNGAMGIVMLPVSREVALAGPTTKSQITDLAVVSSIQTDRPIEDAEHLSRLKLKLQSQSIREIPSDGYQTATRRGADWILDIHPPRIELKPGKTIVEAQLDKPGWTKPSLNVPSDSQRFKDLAARIISSKKDVQSASFAIQMYVYQNMKFNSGIGVLRDATEILDTKEGVCRDFAVLTLTLLRAAGIPARLATGLVNADGAFYYHAWTEAWDGVQWIGVDSVTDQAQMSASHVKLGEGNIDTAFTFAFLEKAKIYVLDSQRD